jgi:DHA1 family tetracycline resistance protein-like MFS transporter
MLARMDAASAPRAGRSPLLFIFLTVFIDLLGFGIVIPLLPIYSKAFGASEAKLGLLFSCFSGMQFLFAPMWGRLSDRIGRRPVLIGGLVGTAISYVLFARARSMEMLYFSRILAGFFAANVSAAQAYIADVTSAKDRAKGMGLIGAAFGLGFTFGPAIGGVLSQRQFAALGDLAPNALPALPGLLAAALSLAAAAFGYFKLPEPRTHARDATRMFHLAELKSALRDGRLGTLLLLNYLVIFAWASFEAMFTRYGMQLFPSIFHLTAPASTSTPDGSISKDVLIAGKYAGYYMFFIGILSALVQGGLIRRLVPRFGEVKLLVAGPLFLAIALLIIGAAPSWTVVILGCVVLPFGFGLSNPAIAGLVSRASPERKQGAFLGMSQSASSLARATGPFAAGWLFATFTPRTPFFAGAGLLVVATAIAAVYGARYAATFPPSGHDAPAVAVEA